MKSEDVKEKFIRARAMGHSIRSAAEEAGISKTTAQRWERAYSARISKERRLRLEDLALEYGLTKTARLETLGKLLKRLEQSVNKLDLNKIPPEKQIALYMGTLKNISREYSPVFSMADNESGDFETLLRDFLKYTVSGELTADQALMGARTIGAAAEVYKTTVLQHKVDELAGVLEDVKAEIEELKREK